MKDPISYDTFIRSALAIRFTDDQADFLWDMFSEYKPQYPEDKEYVIEHGISPAKPDQPESVFPSFGLEDVLSISFPSLTPTEKIKMLNLIKYEKQKEYERGSNETYEAIKGFNIRKQISAITKKARTDTLNEVEKIVEKREERLEAESKILRYDESKQHNFARILECTWILHRLQELK